MSEPISIFKALAPWGRPSDIPPMSAGRSGARSALGAALWNNAEPHTDTNVPSLLRRVRGVYLTKVAHGTRLLSFTWLRCASLKISERLQLKSFAVPGEGRLQQRRGRETMDSTEGWCEGLFLLNFLAVLTVDERAQRALLQTVNGNGQGGGPVRRVHGELRRALGRDTKYSPKKAWH